MKEDFIKLVASQSRNSHDWLARLDTLIALLYFSVSIKYVNLVLPLAVDCSHLISFSALSTTIVEGAERRRCFLINRHSSSDRCGADFFIMTQGRCECRDLEPWKSFSVIVILVGIHIVHRSKEESSWKPHYKPQRRGHIINSERIFVPLSNHMINLSTMNGYQLETQMHTCGCEPHHIIVKPCEKHFFYVWMDDISKKHIAHRSLLNTLWREVSWRERLQRAPIERSGPHFHLRIFPDWLL